MNEIIRFIAFAIILIYASIIDIKTHLVNPVIYVILIIIGLINISLSSFMGLAICFIPLFLVGLVSNGGIGGGDIKLVGVCGFVLQGANGLFAIFIGLILAIIIVPILHKAKKVERNIPFALVPYISVGFITTNLIMII